MSNNEYIDLSFDDGVFGTTTGGIVTPSNFNISISGGSATSPVIDAVTTQGSELDAAAQETSDPLTAGETDYRLWISYSGTANGSETVTIEPDNDNGPATPMADDAGGESINPQAGSKTVSLNVLSIPQIVSSTWLDQNADGSIDAVEVRFDIDVNIVDNGNNNIFNNFDINGDIGGSSAQSGVITAGSPFTLTFTPADKSTTGKRNISGLTLSYEQGSTGDKIRSEPQDTEIADEFASPLHIDGADPYFEANPSASGAGVGDVFGGTEVITISADLGESGLTVTADLVDVFGIYSSTETMSEIGSTGVYTFSTFQSRFLNTGTGIVIPITAEDAATNSTTNSTLTVDIDSEAPEVTIDQLFTSDDNSAGQEITIEGTTDDNAMILDVTIDGNTYESDSGTPAIAAAFTIGSGTWSLDLNAAGAGVLAGAYDIDVDAEDVEGNITSESLADGLVVTPGGAVTITPGSLSTACINGEFVTMTNQIVFTEAADNAFSEGLAQTILIALPSGFEFNTSGSATIGLSGTGLSNSGFSFLSPTTLQVRFDANAASLSATNTITVNGLPIKTTSLTSTGTLDMTYQGGTAVLGDLAIGADLGDISNLVPTGPNSGNDFTAEYCFGANDFSSIAGVNSANHIWYDDEDDVYTATINHSGSAITNIATDLGISAAGVHTFYVTNTGGTSCESEPIQVTITINANPVVDAGTDLIGGLAVCSAEGIQLGGSPATLTVATEGPYTYSWTSNEGSVAAFSDDNLAGKASLSNPSIVAPTNTNAYGGADATIRYTLNVSDGNTCSGTDFKDVEVHPAIEPTLDLDPVGGTYTETSIPVDLIVDPAAENPFNEGIFSGQGIIYNSTSMLYEFRPQVVGAGIYPVIYTFEDAVTGCQESVGTTITVTSGAVGATFDNLPNADGGVDAGVCVNETPFTIFLNAADAAFMDGLEAPAYLNRFEAIDISLPDPDDLFNAAAAIYDLPRLSGSIGDFNSNDTYSYNPQEIIDNGGEFGVNTLKSKYRFYQGNPVVTTDDYFWVEQQTRIYPLPEIKILIEDEGTLNFTDNVVSTVEEDYCEDGGNLVFTATVSGQETASGAYRIRRVSPSATAFFSFGNTIDLADPLGANGIFEDGQYEVEFTNVIGDDAADFGGSGCSTTTTTLFNIRATPAAHLLNLAGSSKGIDDFDADPNSGADYTFNYCVDETSFEVLRVLGIDADENVNWYDESFDVLGTSTADGSKIAGSELFATASAFPPDPDVYTFYYTVTDYIGASAGFEGCEGDLTQVQINVFPEVVNPPIDLTSSLRGEDKSSGSEENYFVFEYCQGETVEGLAVVQDNLSEDFNSGVPAGWSGTGTSLSGAGNAQGGAGDAIQLSTSSTSNEIVTTDYQSIQRVSFDYRTTAVGTTGASFVVEANGSEASYQIGSLVANSTTYQTFEADILGSLTDADITIYVDVVGDVDLIIDNFSVASTIPGKTFYQWFDDSNNPITVSATGGVSATATELLGTTTPAADSYTFYVNKIENINTTDTPNFDGCVGETTQIDIIVYSIPVAPIGFTTDINAHSGELNINTRLLSSDLLDIPALANVDYIWSATNAIGATDSINSLTSFPTGDNDNADLSYGELLANLASPIADPSGYYTVTSTYNSTAYLFQVTNELNRETSVFPGCGSATGTPVNFTIYPLAERPILSDTNDVANTNLFFDDNATAGDLTDDLGENLELNFCAGDLAALDSISVVSRYVSGNDQDYTWYRSNGAGDKLLEIAISDSDGSRATASELFLTGISNDLTTYYLVTQTTDIENGIYDGGESDSVRLRVNIYNIPIAPEPAIALSDSTEFYYCQGETIRDLSVQGEASVDFYWYASEADALAGVNWIHLGATLTPVLMTPDENDFEGDPVANLSGTPNAGTYTFYATQVTDVNPGNEAGFTGPAFLGCESDPIEFTIFVRDVPDAPVLNTDLQRVCQDIDIAPFLVSNRATGAFVTWFEDDGTTIIKNQTTNTFDPDDDRTGGVGVGSVDFLVAQRTDVAFNGSGFAGCISPTTPLNVTRFAYPSAPTIIHVGDANVMVADGGEAGICEGDLGDLNFTSTGNTAATFNWYQSNASGTPIGNAVFTATGAGNTNGSDLDLLAEANGIRYFVVSQTDNIVVSEFSGCETQVANMTLVQVNIFDTPEAPEFIEDDPTPAFDNHDNDLTNGNTTNFFLTFDPTGDYDSQVGGQLTITGTGVVDMTNPDLSNDPAGNISYNWSSPYNTPVDITDRTGNTATIDELNALDDLVGAANNPTSTVIRTISVSQTQFDGQDNNPGSCEGVARTINFNVFPIPATPIPADTDIFICDDETRDLNTDITLTINNIAAGALVEWYLGDPDDLITPGTLLQSSSAITSLTPENVPGHGNLFTAGDGFDETLEIYVRQITNTTVALDNGATYSGSVSATELITITKFEEPDTPTITYNGISSTGTQPNTAFQVGICEGDLNNAGFSFSFGSLETTPTIRWYSVTNATKSSPSLVYSTGVGNTVTATNLDLLTAGEDEYFFVVTQVAETASFDGCETTIAEGQLVQINVFGIPDFPTFDAGSNNALTTTGDVTDFYLVYDSAGIDVDNGNVSFYNDQLKDDVFTTTGLNVINGLSLTNTAGQQFNWYYSNTVSPRVTPGATADFDGLSMTAILPQDGPGANDFNNPTTIEAYSFEVRQAQFRNQNANPEACESPSQFVNVNIVPVPDTPTPAETLVEICEDESVGSLSITNRAPGAQVHWFGVDPRGMNPEPDTLNFVNGVLDGQTYIPTEVEGNAGTRTYFVRQVNNIEIDGTNFTGAVSEVAEVTVTVYPNAGVPESTAENNEYIYCLGDRIEDLQVLNPENGVTYAWYGDINLNSFLGNTTSTSNFLIPSLNGAFDENTVGTYNYYVTSTLSGQGCESNPTLVQIIINGLPDPEIKFNTGLTFENEEDVPEFYQICIDESPLAILGSSAGSVFGTFTGEGVTQGANGSATFDPLLALGIDDPLEMPEFGIDTIMVNYNLANTNDCDDDFKVGFVVTALPRPNFEASISSPLNVPVLLEGEDAGVACVDVDPNNLATVTRMTLRASGGRRTGSFFVRNSAKDTVLSIANGSVEFPLSDWSDPTGTKTQDTLFITYTFADEFGCSYFKDKTIILHENPIVEYQHIVGCVGEPATFMANAVAPFSDTDIEFWDWSLVNSRTGQTDESTSFTNGDQTIITTLLDSSSYIVSVRGRSANYEPIENLATCVSIDESTINASTPAVNEERDEIGNTQLIPIGDFPVVDFSWQFITENEATLIEGKETGLADLRDVNNVLVNGVSQVWMDWGDGSPLDTLLATEGIGKAFGFEEHTYTSDGWYNAKLKINTINGCVDSTTKVIKILPHIIVDPTIGLLNDFEASTQPESGWFVDETEMGSALNKEPTTWKYGSLSVDGFTGQGWSTNSNDQAGVLGGYKSDPGSWVFSPSYDISGLEKPMVKFDGIYDFAQNDGAIMEYSTNNGASWNILGKYLDGDDQGTGIFWYGTLDIRADPGKQRDQANVNNASGWGFNSNVEFLGPVSIRHKLDEIPENERESVRFRFHFASSSASAADIPGLVFDDFAITERGRISLVEQFSNSNINRDNSAGTSNPSVILNNELNARLDSALLNNNDIVAVNYYTELYGNDPLFEISQDGPSARTLFYGLSDVTSILDGDVSMGASLSTNASTTPWTGAESNRNTLQDAEFGLELILNSSNNDELSVTANITSQKDFTGEDVRVYLAVVEKVLVGVSLPNLELEPRNVFREFLPSPLGHVLTDLTDGGSNTLTETWKIDARKVLDPDQLAVVAFVQKANGDREVYQAARVDINGKTSILGVGDLIEVDDLNLYPNPANDEFFITFDLTLEEDFQWRLFDQSGRLMKNGEVFKGMDGFRVESANLPSGLYLMSIGNESKQYTHLKVIVKH
ncbi:MAG: T9SS type A sorting domain-containing protein [Cyclobacteriaceae bacterium]